MRERTFKSSMDELLIVAPMHCYREIIEDKNVAGLYITLLMVNCTGIFRICSFTWEIKPFFQTSI